MNALNPFEIEEEVKKFEVLGYTVRYIGLSKHYLGGWDYTKTPYQHVCFLPDQSHLIDTAHRRMTGLKFTHFVLVEVSERAGDYGYGKGRVPCFSGNC